MPLPKNLPGGNIPRNPQRPNNRDSGNNYNSGDALPGLSENNSSRLGSASSGEGSRSVPSRNRTNQQRTLVPKSSSSVSGNQRSHTEEYDFEERDIKERSISSVKNNRDPYKNPYDDEDPFTPLNVDEQLESEYAEDEEASEHIIRDRLRNNQLDTLSQQRNEDELAKRRKALESLEDNIDDDDDDHELDDDSETLDDDSHNIIKKKPSRRNRRRTKSRKDKKGRNVFVDEKKGKIKSFGGSRSKRKLKEGQFDVRKNKRQEAIIVRGVVIGLVGIVAILGVKNSFFPPHQWTQEEIASISTSAIGMTNFPLDEGRGFATDFMKAYLTTNVDDTSKKVLGYYYSGVMDDNDSSTSRTVSSDFKQEVVFGPTVYSSKSLTDYSAQYVIGAVVKDTAVEGATPSEGSEPHWMYFAVNVYYNADKDNFTITPDSPSVVPATEVGSESDVPELKALGNGESDDELGKSIESVVYGYLKGYVSTSPTDHSALDQYIIVNPPADLLKGLNNSYEFAGDISDAVQYTAYKTDDPNVVKAEVTVNWRNKLGGEETSMKAEYKSNYSMTLEKQSNGQYLVSKFQPIYYVQADKDDDK